MGKIKNHLPIFKKNCFLEAELQATDVGTIEIKATYESCRAKANKSVITKTAKIHVGQWVSTDCT